MPQELSPPTVLMIANYPRSTGYAWWLMDRFWSEITAAAQGKGWRAEVVYPPEPDGGGGGTEAVSRIEAFLSGGTLRDWPAIPQLVRRLRINSIYLTDRPMRSWKYLALRMGGVRCIVVHDHTPGDRPPITGIKGSVKGLLNTLPWITADFCVSVSPLMRQRHSVNARIPASRCETVTNGVILKDLIPGARETLRRRFEIPEDGFIVAGVGRLNRYKRFDVAVRTLASLARPPSQVNPFLLLVGDGPERQSLTELADALDVRHRVIMVGQVDDVWPILCGADAVHHPSQGEGLSLGILEAMAAAKPVVVPDVPTVCQTIDHEVTGLVYRDRDIAHAATLLRHLAGDADFRTTIGLAARQRVMDEYGLDETLAMFRNRIVPRLLNR